MKLPNTKTKPPILPEQIQMLKNGFAWYKNGTTDKVYGDIIQDIKPVENGFIVYYNEKASLVTTQATVKEIDWGLDPNSWILVYWEEIFDTK